MVWDFIRIVQKALYNPQTHKLAGSFEGTKMNRSVILIISLLLLLPISACGLDLGVYRFISENNDYRHQWAMNGSSSYVIQSSLLDFSVDQGTYIITVSNGNIVSVKIVQARWLNSVTAADFPSFEQLTIEGMFNYANLCAEHSWDWKCSFTYDPKYGYPTSIVINCSNPDLCNEDIKATLISLGPTPTMVTNKKLP